MVATVAPIRIGPTPRPAWMAREGPSGRRAGLVTTGAADADADADAGAGVPVPALWTPAGARFVELQPASGTQTANAVTTETCLMTAKHMKPPTRRTSSTPQTCPGKPSNLTAARGRDKT